MQGPPVRRPLAGGETASGVPTSSTQPLIMQQSRASRPDHARPARTDPEPIVLDTRLILVDGDTVADRTCLTQQIAVQLGAEAVECSLWHANGRGHPLRRPWDAASYPDAAQYMDTLLLQWQNFAIRAAAEPGVWLFDAGLADAPASLRRAGAATADDAAALAERLVEALEPLSPVLLYLWHETPADAHRQQLMDAIFARLPQHRALLNASRSSPAERLGDALAFLGLPRREVTLAPELAVRLTGHYGTADRWSLQISSGEQDALTVSGLDGCDAPLPLLPTVDGRLLVGGRDLALHPNLDRAGTVLGLMLETTDPRLAAVPEFLPRRAG